jgi:hypothetical protein
LITRWKGLNSVVRSIRKLPSCKEFAQQLRAQSVSRFTEGFVKGSSYEFDGTTAEHKISFLRVIREQQENEVENSFDTSGEILEKINELKKQFVWDDFSMLDSELFFNDLEINSFYYVLGYLLYRVLKDISCELCKERLVSSANTPNRYNKLTRIRSTCQSLNFLEPSEKSFEFYLKLENLFVKLQNLELDVLSNVQFRGEFESIAMMNITFDGEHCQQTTNTLIVNFAKFRLYMNKQERNLHQRSKFSSKSMK